MTPNTTITKRIVLGPNYGGKRYAHAFDLCGYEVVKSYGCVAEGKFDAIEKAEAWGLKTWGKCFELVLQGNNGSETINY